MDLAERFKNIDPNLALAHCLAALDEGKAPPRERLIFPAGEFKTTKGTFLFDDAAAKMVMADWQEWTGGLSQKGSADYEHDQTKENIPGYQKIDSASYDLTLRKGALWAVEINWTALAAGMIVNREKRYTSPWWLYEKASKRICRYINFGLVSLPATLGQPEIMAAAASAGGVPESGSFVGYFDMATASAAVVSETAGAVPHKKYDLDKSASWDGDAARKHMREWASSDGSGDWAKVDRKKYAAGFAYVKGDGSRESDYLLPHHDVKDGALVTVWGGVKAAGAAVQGARAKVDIPEADLPAVRHHLVQHYHEFGKTAPWEKKPARASEEFRRILDGTATDSDRELVQLACLEDDGEETAAIDTTTSETAKMAAKADYSDKNFVPSRHAYALRYMASAAMENMMTAIHLHNEVPMMSAAMKLPEHCAALAEHVMHCAAAMQHHMHDGDASMDDGEPDGDEASKAAVSLPAETKAKVDEAIAACKAAKCGGLLQKAHKAALASVQASRFDKSALQALAGAKDMIASVFTLTGEKTAETASAALVALSRDMPELRKQAAEAEAKAAKAAGETAAALAAADQVKYDQLVKDAMADGKVIKGDDEKWVRENVKGIASLEAYLRTKRKAPIATTHEQASGAQVLASQTKEQREQIIASTDLTPEQYAGWAATGGGAERLKNLQEQQARKLGLIS